MMDPDSLDELAQAFQLAEQRMRNWVERHSEQLPASADAIPVGLMWEFYRATGDAFWLQNAEKFGQLVEDRWNEHPGESVCSPACVYSHLPWYEYSKDRERREWVFRAASDLARRFHHQGRFLGLPDQPNHLALSVMLEVPVSFYTANETLDQDIARHATAHCRTTRDRLIGDDGSASSVAEYRSDTALFTPGGDPNCSRNVGLALLGFSQVYGLTNAAEFLKVAERCAEYWLAHLPPDRLARLSVVDDSPSVPGKAQDLVASAIATCALLELAEQTRVKEHAVAYRSTGLAMLDALCQQGGQDVVSAARDTTPLLRVDDTHIQDWLGDFYFARALRLGQASSR